MAFKFLNSRKYRQRRTVFLALFATLTFVGSAIYIFDIDTELMLNIFLLSALLIGGMVLLALLAVLLLKLFKGLFNKM